MKKKLLLSLLLCAAVLSSGCGNEKTQEPETTATVISTETEHYSGYMLKYKDKIISKEYYEYMLSITKYDFLDMYTNYANEYAKRGLDFGMAYFGTEIADTEEFWSARMTDDGKTVTVADIVKSQTLTFAKCVSVFDSIMKEHGLTFSDSTKEKAESSLKTRTGDNAESVLSRFGVTGDEALYAELVSAGLDEIRDEVCKEGGAAEITGEMTDAELAKSVRYKAISYYGEKEATEKKAKKSYDRIISGETSFDDEIKKSDDFGELTGEYADGTVLSKEEFCELFGLESDSRTFSAGDIFLASNDNGSYVIRIEDRTEADRENAFSTIKSSVFTEFLKTYTSNIEIDEKAVERIDFFMIARTAP